MCDNCAYLNHDSCMDGYCGNENSNWYHHIVVSDKGCVVQNCPHFIYCSLDKDVTDKTIVEEMH